MKKIYVWAIVAFLAGYIGTTVTGIALAHTGTPAFTVFSNGQTLTASALNANFAHLHNTLNGGISNANIAPNAAISLSKIQAGAGLPRAMGYVGEHSGVSEDSPCTGTDAAVNCPGTFTGASVTPTGPISGCAFGGCYYIRLNFTPKNTGNNLVVQLTTGVHSGNTICRAYVNPADVANIKVVCANSNDTGTAAAAAFHFTVWEI